MKILVLNSGSSSVKYKLFDLPEEKAISSGVVERIGEPMGKISFNITRPGQEAIRKSHEEKIVNHQQGLHMIADFLLKPAYSLLKDAADIEVVGHRVVHGGEIFRHPVRIDEQVMKEIDNLSTLAPLHNPANLEGIRVALQVFSKAQQVAVFDTAFHHTMPAHAFEYAIPEKFYQQEHIRVYGMHGTSHQFVTEQAAAYLKKDLADCNFISIHLGNGCSMTAVAQGQSIDTSMGFSPLTGLIMGTRSGDIDPAVILHMGSRLKMPLDVIDKTLNKESGLKGLTGSNDLRDIEQRCREGDAQAAKALAMYTYRIRKYVGAYAAVLGRVDAIIFTAGVGENSTYIRQQVCQGLGILQLVFDEEKNRQQQVGIREIQADGSAVKVLVVPTDEELAIARQAQQLLSSQT